MSKYKYVLLFILAFGSLQTTLADEHIDLIEHSAKWWGIGINDFPGVSGLAQYEYSVGDHPSRPAYKVIVPRVQKKWLPHELSPLEFNFLPDKDLQEISGFISSDRKKIVAAMKARYGEPTRILQALHFTTYVWVFDKTVFEITDLTFTIFPKDRMKQ